MDSAHSALNQQRVASSANTSQEHTADQTDKLVLIQSPTPSNLSEATTYSDQRTTSKSSATTAASSKSSSLSPQKSNLSGSKESYTGSSSSASISSTAVKNDSKASTVDTTTASSKQSSSVLSTSVLSHAQSPNGSNTQQTPSDFVSQVSSHPNMSSPHTTNGTRTGNMARPEAIQPPQQTLSAIMDAHMDSYTSLNKKTSASA